MTVRRLEVRELALAASFIASYPFKPYRNYRVFPRKRQDAVMLEEIRRTIEDPKGLVLHVEAGGQQAVAVARVLDWESRFFEIPMGRIEYVMTRDAALRSKTIGVAIAALRDEGVRHVSARVDVADIETTGMLEAHGFRTMDALVTYTARPRKDLPNPVREAGLIRTLREADGPELLQIAAEAYRGFRGRFHLDPHIPDSRCDAFYLEWARQSIDGVMADTALVSEGAAGRLAGFLAWRKREPVSSVGGVAVFGGGLGACRADAPGAYAGLIRAGTLWAHERDGVAECQTQNFNFATVRIYEAVGAHYVRAEYTLHAWLG